MENIRIKLGNRIKTIRLERKMSREQIARRIGIKQQTIEKYEKGDINISINRLIQISNVLNVGITYFLIDENNVDNPLFKHYINLQIQNKK